MTSLLIVLLAAAPVNVVVVRGFSDELRLQGLELLESRLPRSELVNGTNVFWVLNSWSFHRQFQSLLDGFTQPPPPGWPAAIDGAWTKDLAYCRDLVGPPPWHEADKLAAWGCAVRVRSHLWNVYLAFYKAKQVYELDAREDFHPDMTSVRAAVYEPRSPQMREVSQERVKDAEISKVMEEVVASLFSGKGGRVERQVTEAVASRVAGDPFLGKAPRLDAVPLENRCDRLPGRLVFSGASTLEGALAKRWAASVPAGTGEVRCTVSLSRHQEDGPLPIPTLAAAVHCGQARAQAEVSQMAARPPVDIATERLVTRLVNSFCQ